MSFLRLSLVSCVAASMEVDLPFLGSDPSLDSIEDLLPDTRIDTLPWPRQLIFNGLESLIEQAKDESSSSSSAIQLSPNQQASALDAPDSSLSAFVWLSPEDVSRLRAIFQEWTTGEPSSLNLWSPSEELDGMLDYYVTEFPHDVDDDDDRLIFSYVVV